MPNKAINFGVDLLPVTSLSYSLGSEDKKWNIYGTLAGNAESASAANITSTTNAISIYTDTTGTFGSVTSVAGALYSTTDNGSLTFGILPVALGGSGTSSMTAYGVAYGNSDTTALNFTNAGTTGYPLIGDGTNAPKWYDGLILKGIGADSYTANFTGNTDATSTTLAAVTISGGLGIGQSMFIGGNILPSTTNVVIGNLTTSNRQIKAIHLINGTTTSHGIFFSSTSVIYGLISLDTNSSLKIAARNSITLVGTTSYSATAALIRILATSTTAGKITPGYTNHNIDIGDTTYRFNKGYFKDTVYSQKFTTTDTNNDTKVYTVWNDTDKSLDFIFNT